MCSARCSYHLTWEYAWSNSVDSDLEACVGDLRSQHLGQVIGGAFARIVREVALGIFRDARNRGDVDNGASVAVLVLGGFCD